MWWAWGSYRNMFFINKRGHVLRLWRTVDTPSHFFSWKSVYVYRRSVPCCSAEKHNLYHFQTKTQHIIWFQTIYVVYVGSLNTGSLEKHSSSPLLSLTPVSHCKRKQGVFFSAPMLTDESVHTARRGGAAARSRSRAGAAVPRSFRRRVYFCCAAYAQLKWQDIIYDRHSKKKHI